MRRQRKGGLHQSIIENDYKSICYFHDFGSPGPLKKLIMVTFSDFILCHDSYLCITSSIYILFYMYCICSTYDIKKEVKPYSTESLFFVSYLFL